MGEEGREHSPALAWQGSCHDLRTTMHGAASTHTQRRTDGRTDRRMDRQRIRESTQTDLHPIEPACPQILAVMGFHPQP